jgi:hypothetical protein
LARDGPDYYVSQLSLEMNAVPWQIDKLPFLEVMLAKYGNCVMNISLWTGNQAWMGADQPHLTTMANCKDMLTEQDMSY